MIDEITVSLKDLKVLGKQGGATARLEDGTDLILKPDYAVKQAKGYVDGHLRDVEFHLPYKKVYDQIRTIKRDAQVIARKVKTPSGMELRLTGRGYNRQNKEKEKLK